MVLVARVKRRVGARRVMSQRVAKVELEALRGQAMARREGRRPSPPGDGQQAKGGKGGDADQPMPKSKDGGQPKGTEQSGQEGPKAEESQPKKACKEDQPKQSAEEQSAEDQPKVGKDEAERKDKPTEAKAPEEPREPDDPMQAQTEGKPTLDVPMEPPEQWSTVEDWASENNGWTAFEQN